MNEKIIDYVTVTLIVVAVVASAAYSIFEASLRLSAYLAIANGC